MRIALLVPLLSLGCAAAWRDDYDRLVADLDPIGVRHEAAPAGPSTDLELDRTLSGSVDAEALLAVARRRNPELRETAARAQAALEEVRRAGALDDPVLKIETEGVPLRQPSAFNRSEQNMIGLMQMIPFPGNLSLRSEAALRQAEAAYQAYRERELELALRLKRAWAEAAALGRELEIHREHIGVMERFERASEVKFRTGAASQQDVLKPQVEIVMLHGEVLQVEQKLGSARAEVNRLLHRPSDAPLGPPRETAPPAETFDPRELAARALEARPELRAAELRVKAARAGLALAERQARLPDFSVGVDYMQMTGEPDAWAGMLSINLPWLGGKRRAEARRMERELRAEEAALEAARARVLFEVRDALLRAEAARRMLELYRRELLAKSAQSVEVSRASYERDKASFLDLLDAERSLRDVSLRHVQAAAEAEKAAADLERAAGADLRRKP